MNEKFREIARATADYHEQCYASYLPPDQQARIHEVIEDLVFTALYAAFEQVPTYPARFSLN